MINRKTLVIEISADKYPILQKWAEDNHRYPPQEAAHILEQALTLKMATIGVTPISEVVKVRSSFSP